MIATFNEQTEAGLWLPHLMNKPEAVLWLPPSKEQTEAVLWLPALKNKPRLCYDCHL